MGHSVAPLGQSFKRIEVFSPFLNRLVGYDTILRRSVRNHERFLANPDALETPPQPSSSSNDDNASADGDDVIVERAVYAFLLSEALRPGVPRTRQSRSRRTTRFWSGHTIRCYSTSSCSVALPLFSARSSVVPRVSIFLPPRSMAQIVFVETLERLAGGWRIGTQPHSRARTRARRRNNNTPNASKPLRHPRLHFFTSCSIFSHLPCAC